MEGIGAGARSETGKGRLPVGCHGRLVLPLEASCKALPCAACGNIASLTWKETRDVVSSLTSLDETKFI